MKRNKVLVLLLFIVIGFTTTNADPNPNLGKSAPDFKLNDLSDHVVKLSDFKGKNVVLVFYVHSGRQECRKQLGELQERIAEIKELNAEIIALATKGDRKSEEKTKNELNITFSIIPETKPKVAKSFDVWNNEWNSAIATVIVDKNGIIRYHHKAFDDIDRPSASQVIKKLKEINSTEAGATSESSAPKTENNNKNIVIDGSLDDWPSDVVTISDPQGDVSLSAKDERGVDLKAVRAFMDDNYLYVAIQIYGAFEASLLRNYFIALDYDKDKQDEYHFGVRSNGKTWVFDHRRDKYNSKVDDTRGVMAAGGDDTIELMIPKKNYEIPSSILIYCRVTEGGPTVDKTDWFKVDAK